MFHRSAVDRQSPLARMRLALAVLLLFTVAAGKLQSAEPATRENKPGVFIQIVTDVRDLPKGIFWLTMDSVGDLHDLDYHEIPIEGVEHLLAGQAKGDPLPTIHLGVLLPKESLSSFLSVLRFVHYMHRTVDRQRRTVILLVPRNLPQRSAEQTGKR